MVSGGITLKYQKADKLFTLAFDREKDLGYGRRNRSVHLESCRQIRILADTSCLEIYINGGEEVFTTRFYTEDGMSDFHIDQGEADVINWEMEGFHVDYQKETK